MGLIGKVIWRRRVGFDPMAVLNGRKKEIARLQGLVIYDVLKPPSLKTKEGDRELLGRDFALAWGPDGRRFLFECAVEKPSEEGWAGADDIADVWDRTESIPDTFALEEIPTLGWQVPLGAQDASTEIPGVGPAEADSARIRRRVTEGAGASAMPESGWYAQVRRAGEDEFAKDQWWVILDEQGTALQAFKAERLNTI